MKATCALGALSLLLGAEACYVVCADGTSEDVGSAWQTPCPGSQMSVHAAPGFADIVYFDGGKHYQCADGEGFSLKHIKQNVVGCANGYRGKCCGTERC